MCEQNMAPTTINVWIKYGTHHVSMCEQNMAPTTYQCVKHWLWWVPYFVHTLISGGYHILFTHWSWWVPYFVHTLIRGGYHILFTHCTHHLSMCEQNMAPTTYQCVNKIWYPPRINVWTKLFCSHIDKWWVPYFVHTLIRGGCHILFTHWSWWVPYFVHTLIVMVPTTINVWTKYDTHHVSMCE
jgi:hypothetical protein